MTLQEIKRAALMKLIALKHPNDMQGYFKLSEALRRYVAPSHFTW